MVYVYVFFGFWYKFGISNNNRFCKLYSLCSKVQGIAYCISIPIELQYIKLCGVLCTLFLIQKKIEKKGR